jgi:hypothetical protein
VNNLDPECLSGLRVGEEGLCEGEDHLGREATVFFEVLGECLEVAGGFVGESIDKGVD